MSHWHFFAEQIKTNIRIHEYIYTHLIFFINTIKLDLYGHLYNIHECLQTHTIIE